MLPDQTATDGVAASEPLKDDEAENLKVVAMNYSEIDQVSLELARQVAERVRRRPELLDLARTNLTHWSRQNASATSLLRCYAEWQEILSRPLDEICDLLCSESEEAQRLRQNSPFVGVLSPSEIWAIKTRFRHASATA